MALHDVDPNTTNRIEPMPQASDQSPTRSSDGTTAITNKQDGSSGAYVSTKDATVKVNDGTIDVIKLGLQSSGSYAFQFSDSGFPRLLMSADNMKISQEGVDVNSATDAQLIFNSSQNVFKIVASDTVVLAGRSLGATSSLGTSAALQSVAIPPGLTKPLVIAVGSDDGFQYVNWSGPITSLDGLSGGNVVSTRKLVAYLGYNGSNIEFSYTAFNATGSSWTIPAYTIRYYILQETAN